MGNSEQPLESTRQRLDKWLFFARMAKSRSLAQSYVQSGQVKINGVVVRQPSHAVKPGDRLEISFERMDRVVVVKSGGTPGAAPMKKPDFSMTIRRRRRGLPTG